MVRACRPPDLARSGSGAGRRSTRTTSPPARASSAASISPVGPAPAITTACSAIRRSFASVLIGPVRLAIKCHLALPGSPVPSVAKGAGLSVIARGGTSTWAAISKRRCPSAFSATVLRSSRRVPTIRGLQYANIGYGGYMRNKMLRLALMASVLCAASTTGAADASSLPKIQTTPLGWYHGWKVQPKNVYFGYGVGYASPRINSLRYTHYNGRSAAAYGRW